MEHEGLTGEIIGAFHGVYVALGCGFLEKVYENALGFEFEYRRLKFNSQAPIKIGYRGKIAGDYFADFIVEDKVPKFP